MRLIADETKLGCFRFVKKMLDALYERDATLSNNFDEVIQDSLNLLRIEYNNLKYGEVPSYNTNSRNFAYIYCYLAAHANIMYNLLNLEDSKELANAFNGNTMKLSCIGGGPGSDFLGILKFLQCSNKTALLKFDTYDREENWFESLKMWRKLLPDVYTQFQVAARFAKLDVSNPVSWKQYPQLWEADLFTISYIMSEVFPIKEDANTFFLNLFEQAKSGAFFIFVDNISVPTHKWFDGLVEKYNHSGRKGHIRLINTSDWYPSQQYSFQMEFKERKEDLIPYYGRYYSQIGKILYPRLEAVVVFRICRKM